MLILIYACNPIKLDYIQHNKGVKKYIMLLQVLIKIKKKKRLNTTF